MSAELRIAAEFALTVLEHYASSNPQQWLGDAGWHDPNGVHEAHDSLRAALVEIEKPAAEPDVESSIAQLCAALVASKGWMCGYADAVIRDAIDRRPPTKETP